MFYTGQWINTPGEAGPWSEVASATVLALLPTVLGRVKEKSFESDAATGSR